MSLKPPRLTGDAVLEDRQALRGLILTLCWRDAEPDHNAVNIALRNAISAFAKHFGTTERRVIAHIETAYHRPTGTLH